jgi:DNA-binding protein HU-beta
VSILTDKSGVPKKSCEAVLSALTESMKEEVLMGGNEIRIRDFGTFKPKSSAAREGRNPKTGEAIHIKSSKSIGFSCSSSLKVKGK